MRRLLYCIAILFVSGLTFSLAASITAQQPGDEQPNAQQPAAEVLPSPGSYGLRAVSPARQLTPQERVAEIARLRYHLYRRVEYPLRLSQLDAEIEVATAEVQALARQIREYEEISRPNKSDPFLVTLESARIRQLATQLRLKNLRKEKLLLLQNFQTERRLRKLEIEAGMP